MYTVSEVWMLSNWIWYRSVIVSPCYCVVTSIWILHQSDPDYNYVYIHFLYTDPGHAILNLIVTGYRDMVCILRMPV